MGSYPEGWEFLGEIPDPWNPPIELRRGNRSPMLNLIIEIISSNLVGNDILLIAGRVLSEYAAFNAWCSPSRGGLDFEKKAQLSLKISYLVRDLYSSWKKFSGKFEQSRRIGIAIQERDALRAELETAESEIRAMRDLG